MSGEPSDDLRLSKTYPKIKSMKEWSKTCCKSKTQIRRKQKPGRIPSSSFPLSNCVTLSYKNTLWRFAGQWWATDETSFKISELAVITEYLAAVGSKGFFAENGLSSALKLEPHRDAICEIALMWICRSFQKRDCITSLDSGMVNET